jgi:PAS domain S-box-containing protein
MKDTLKILFNEDVRLDAELILRELKKNNIIFKELLVDNKKDFIAGLKSFNPDLIISDYSLPQFTGMQSLLIRNEMSPLTPFILVTGSNNETVAVECMKAGADDYVLKDNLSRLGLAINNSLKKIEVLKQKKDAEDALRESEERYRILYSDAIVGLYRTNLQGEILLANNTLVKMLGFNSFDELATRNLSETGYGSFYQRKQFIEQIEKKAEVRNHEAIWICKDGKEIFVRENAKPVFDTGGKIICYDGTVEDITSRKKAEKELHESEMRYRSIFENVQDLYYESSMDGTILEVSPSISNLSHGQYYREDLIGKSINEFYSFPGEREMLMEALMTNGSISDFEIKLRNRDGSLIPCSVSAKISLDSDGNPSKIIGSMRDISERKKAEDALTKSKKEFQNYFESSAVGLSVTLPDKKFIEVNQRLCNMVGYTKEELIGMTWMELSHPDDLSRNIELFQQSLDGKIDNYDLEKRFICKDGRVLYMTTSVVCERNQDDTVHHHLASYINVTERVLAEERIHSEQVLLRTLIDNLPDPIYVMDKNCRKVIANEADLKNIGYTTEDKVLGKNDIELFRNEIGVRGHRDNEEIIRTGNPIIEREEDFVDIKGVRRWLLTTKIPLHDKDGIITGLVGIGHDITERKLAEEKLRHSFEFNNSLLKTIPFGMDIVDETGTLMFQSENFKKLFGEEAIGEKCWEIYRDDKRQCSGCPLTKGITIGETEAYESAGVLGNKIFEISHTGMIYNGKKAMLEIFQDITERKINEAELISAKKKAEESDNLKTAFLHNISHEIRTPMNAIVGFSALLGEPDLDNATQQSYIETIMQSSNHLLSIINDIVDISNIEANLVKTSKHAFDINSMLESLCNQFRLKASEKGINLTCESGLTNSEKFIVADSIKLTQIILNLVNNALKFTEKGSVIVSLRKTENFLHFSVNDTGIGIPSEFHQRIFDRFFQVNNMVSRIYEGTGLGLAISKAYVEIMGGKIWLSSDPGKGTIFHFTIPYEKQVDSELPKVEMLAPEALFFKRKMRILVAEDVDSNFKLIKYFLSGSNAEIIRAVNGKEAVDKTLSEKNIDLIFMDIKMPVMDGYTAINLIREANIKIPIVAQTAYIDDRDKAISAGCDGFISKPFDKKKFLEVLSEFI